MTKDQILAALPKLNKADLESISVTAQALLGGHLGAVDGPATPLAGLVFEALCSVINSPVAYATVRGTAPGKVFEKRAADLGNFLNLYFNGWDETKLMQMAVLRMMFDLLKANLEVRKIPISFASMTYNIGAIPKVFKDAFPGYIEAGIASGILNRLKRMERQ